MSSVSPVQKDHRFLDEAGDTAFYGKGRRSIIGENGVSLSFAIGMVKINENHADVRKTIKNLQVEVALDPYLNVIPSVQKRILKGGFFFHATDDPAEVRQIFYKYLRGLDCSIEIVVARKKPEIYAAKHNNKEAEFYADVLSHLIKNKLRMGHELVLNIAQRGNSTSNRNLQVALNKAMGRFLKNGGIEDMNTRVAFNVQNHFAEPLLNIADYLSWSVQRVFERGETRYYDYMRDKISLVIDLYDTANYRGSGNYYRRDHILTAENKICPPST